MALMHNLLKTLLLAWQPANLVPTHNTRIQLQHWALIRHANIFFCTLLLLLGSSSTNEDLLNYSLINYYLYSKHMLNVFAWDKIPAICLRGIWKHFLGVQQLRMESQCVPEKTISTGCWIFILFWIVWTQIPATGESVCSGGYENEKKPEKPKIFFMTLMVSRLL